MNTKQAIVAAGLLCLCGLSWANYDGSLDLTFGSAGVAQVTGTSRYYPSAISSYADGRLVIAGSITDQSAIFDLRLTPSGIMDTSFQSGMAYLLLSSGYFPNANNTVPNLKGNAVSVTPTGSIYTAGQDVDRTNVNHGVVVLIDHNGHGFDGGTKYSLESTDGNLVFNSIVPLPGTYEFITAGTSTDSFGNSMFAVQYYDNASLNASFAQPFPLSISTQTHGEHGLAMAYSAELGRIVVVGQVQRGTFLSDGSADTTCGIEVLKLTQLSDGSHALNFDSSWGALTLTPGQTVLEFGQPGTFDHTNVCRAVAIQPDGKIVVGGELFDRTDKGIASYWGLARFNEDGSIDTGFAANGGGCLVDTVAVGAGCQLDNFGEFGPGVLNGINALALQNDGKIVFGGYSGVSGGSSYFGIGRLNPDGVADGSTFGNTGRGTIQVGSNSQQYVTGMTLDSQRPVLVGPFFDANGNAQTMVVRLNNDHIFGDGLGFPGSN